MGLYAWILIVSLIAAVIGACRHLGTSLVIFGLFGVLLVAYAPGHLTL